VDQELLGGGVMRTKPGPRVSTRLGEFTALAGIIGLAALGCAPTPRSVPCSNDRQCAELSDDFNYCLQSRCVECISSESCGDGNTCIDGQCFAECTDNRACPDDHVCMEGVCAPE
jgi:hypothetical protein